MKTAELKAVMVSNEINLNDIAAHFGIKRKFKWEDTLYLGNKQLEGIIKEANDKRVYIFYFGCMVFVNMAIHEINDVVNYVKKLDDSILKKANLNNMEQYRLESNETVNYKVENDSMMVPEIKEFHLEIAATVLAKSVAVDVMEIDIDALFDSIENIIQRLNKGRLSFSDQQLATLSAKILTFKYNTISYIMLLDKPDIVWDNADAEVVYLDLSTLFELDDRYEKIRHKTETLMDITEMFTGLVHAKRGNRLEWVIIILIFIELIIGLFDFLPKLFSHIHLG